MRITRRVLTALAIMTGLLLSTAGAAGAAPTTKYLHAHINAYGSDIGGCGTSEWSSYSGWCGGSGESGGAGSPFIGSVRVSWCDPGPSACKKDFNAFFANSRITKPALPPGYSREMLLENTLGEWVYGGVKMPNGPFVVLVGSILRQPVVAEDPNKGVESDGGPLFLYVGYHGGSASNREYVFGFRGYLKY